MANYSDKTEIDQLICSHLPEAMNFAIKLTGDPDTAEEILQDSLLKVSQSWKTFRNASLFKTWFYRIIINTYRSQLKQKPPGLSIDHEIGEKDSENPLSKLIFKETNQMLAAEISKLPLQQREVLILSVYEKFTVTEISESLSISKENVYSTLHVARTRLKKILKPYFSETE